MGDFKIRRALVSVFDKSGLTELARALSGANVEIISSGGTAKALREAGFKAVEVSDYTGAPEIFSGRVKTLHPRIFGGILMRRENEADKHEAEQKGVLPIDLVVVNLYPFKEKAVALMDEAEILKEIDIGGVALLRAAAKNYAGVAVLCSPAQYDEFIGAFKSGEGISLNLRSKWSRIAFAHTADYDAAIASYFAGDKGDLLIYGKFRQRLRYGENPHQEAVWYDSGGGLSSARQLWGKELSYLNALDLDAAMSIASDFDRAACVIVKHTTPCGLAVGNSPAEAYRRAFSCDTRSPFGGIVGFNRQVDAEAAEEMEKIFLEAVIAPGFSAEALERLKKKKNLRLVEFSAEPAPGERKIISISGGFLAQDKDDAPITRDNFKVVTERQPSEEQWEALEFGAKAVKWVKSNAVALCSRFQTLGIGGGQTSRVGSVEIAVANAKLFGHSLEGSVMASDAFFPFPDSVEEAAKVGVKAVVQPGGSVRDSEVIEAANRLGIAMVFTGKRHFRH